MKSQPDKTSIILGTANEPPPYHPQLASSRSSIPLLSSDFSPCQASPDSHPYPSPATGHSNCPTLAPNFTPTTVIKRDIGHYCSWHRSMTQKPPSRWPFRPNHEWLKGSEHPWPNWSRNLWFLWRLSYVLRCFPGNCLIRCFYWSRNSVLYAQFWNQGYYQSDTSTSSPKGPHENVSNQIRHIHGQPKGIQQPYFLPGIFPFR